MMVFLFIISFLMAFGVILTHLIGFSYRRSDKIGLFVW